MCQKLHCVAMTTLVLLSQNGTFLVGNEYTKQHSIYEVGEGVVTIATVAKGYTCTVGEQTRL